MIHYIISIVIIAIIIRFYQSVLADKKSEFNSMKSELVRKYEERIKLKSLRIGDAVYVNKEGFIQGKPYYLIDSYNGGYCYHVSNKPDDKIPYYNERQSSVHIDDIRIERPKVCELCHSFLN